MTSTADEWTGSREGKQAGVQGSAERGRSMRCGADVPSSVSVDVHVMTSCGAHVVVPGAKVASQRTVHVFDAASYTPSADEPSGNSHASASGASPVVVTSVNTTSWSALSEGLVAIDTISRVSPSAAYAWPSCIVSASFSITPSAPSPLTTVICVVVAWNGFEQVRRTLPAHDRLGILRALHINFSQGER